MAYRYRIDRGPTVADGLKEIEQFVESDGYCCDSRCSICQPGGCEWEAVPTPPHFYAMLAAIVAVFREWPRRLTQRERRRLRVLALATRTV